jgi:hypothetical protein
MRRLGMSRETVRSATSMPSFRSSPWILGAPPERIGRGHSCDQGRKLGVDGRAAPGGPAGELGPVLAEAATLPLQDGVGGHDHEGPPPPGPDPGEPDPEETISRAKLGPGRRPCSGLRRGGRDTDPTPPSVADPGKTYERDPPRRTEGRHSKNPVDQGALIPSDLAKVPRHRVCDDHPEEPSRR